MKEMIRCNYCGQFKELREFKTADSSVLSDSCSTCCIVIDKVRTIANAKEHGRISEAAFLHMREKILSAYQIKT